MKSDLFPSLSTHADAPKAVYSSVDTWSVVCDFDGTISLADTTDALLERFADPAWHAIEDRWVAGEIGSAECMQQQVALLDVCQEELDNWLDTVKIDPYFKAFVQLCEAHAIPLEIASDGIDYAIHRILRAHGLGHIPVVANRLTVTGPRSYALSAPGPRCITGAGVCKCVIIDQVRARGTQHVLYVGDGRSDFCVSEKVDLVAAKASLLTHCEQLDLPHKAFDHFADVASILTHVISVPRQPLRQDDVRVLA